MKQRLKKGIAFALVVLLLATCVPMRTFAEGNQVPQTQTVETEVETTSAQTDQTHTDQVPTETVQTPTADGAPTQGPEVKTGPVDGDASAAPAQNTPKTQTGETTLQTIQLDVAAVEVIDFGEGSAVVIKEPPQQVVTAAAENGKLTITAVEAGTVSFQVDVSGAAGNQQIQYTVTVLPQNDEQPEQDPQNPADLPAEKTENQEPDQSETITVTFRIDNPDYTRDAGSGNTHITVDAPYAEGQGLTYTQWVKTYKVTGTGVLQSYEIPAGTALTSWPKVNVTNIGDGNAVTYLSSYAWIDGQDSVCSPSAAFTQDTVLSLHLYQDNTSYSLKFVCGGCGNTGDSYHSIPDAMGGYTIAYFTLGQSVSQAYIPTAEDINANYSSEWCQHGKDHGEVFDKWQLKNSATGEMVDFAAGVPITQDYVENGDHSIKVYAQWLKEPVTATFKNGETVVAERQVNRGSALGTLPAVTAPEGQVFQGWEYTDREGSLQLATEETILTQDTVFTAKFVQSQICSVTFRDMPPEGEAAAVAVQVDSGRTLEQAIQASDQSVWADGTSLSQCKWYTLGQDGRKIPAELSNVVSGDMELYTYTYEVVLTLSPQQAAMALSMAEVQDHPDGSITLTITAREGQQLAASDFVIDGVDYSVYTWQTQDGATVSIQNLIQNGLTENITATSMETANETGNIQFFIAKDGEWTVLAEQKMTLYTVGERYALTAAQLESVYGAYGFRAGNLKVGSRMFPHRPSGNDDTIWADAQTVRQDDIVYAQLLRTADYRECACDVFYMPKDYSTNQDGSVSASGLKDAESFYSVEIQDPGHKVYPEGQLPDAAYTLNGETATVRVKTADGVTWQCVGKNGGTVEGKDNGDGTVTFTIQNIDQPYVISPQLAEGEVQVTYKINLPRTPADETYGKPNIQGGEVYTHVAKAENYTLLAPSLTSYFYESGKYLGEATFLGWAIDGSSQDLYLPGDRYTIPEEATQVTFTAQWEEDLGGTNDVQNSTMVNFFVALTAIPEGGTSWVGSTETNFFTDSVFTTDCGVTGNDAVNQELYKDKYEKNGITQYFVLGATSGPNLNAIHNNIVTHLTNGYTVNGYTFRAEFPTDEVIMRQIRSMVDSGTTITLNGKTVPAKDLTAENFTVKWHVFKYDDSDGWHIDGVLVAKTGKLRITKTFAGDAEAIEALNNSYQIQYEYLPFEGDKFIPPHEGGTLTLTDDKVDYDPATNTYTWEVDVDQYRDYQIKEVNFIPDGNQVTTTAQYQVQHSKFAGQNTTGWQTYSDSDPVRITGQSQTDTALQTVSFLNTYTQVGTMTLRKVDALTNGLMANVSFTVAKQGDPGFQLHSLSNGHYTADQSEQGAELAPGNQVTTNANGLVFLDLGDAGTYTFTEVVPTGYEDPGVITVTLGDNGSINHAEAEHSSQNRQFTYFSGSELVVRNYSKVVPLVVEKIWADNENTSVTLQGLVGGQSMGSDYSVDLSNQNWTHTFSQKVPLYINGQQAEYTLRETRIGEWYYSDVYADDGYFYYDVSYDPMVYRNSQKQVVEDPDQAEEIFLSVTNQRSTGALTITKVDQAGALLAGAEFYLYKAPDNPGEPPVPTQDNVLEGVPLVKSATSTDTGQVNFGNVPVGTYYLIEHAAPEFYQGTNTVYLVEVQESSSAMKQWVNDAWVGTAKTVTNTLRTMEVTIKKVVAGNFGDHTKDFAFTVTSDKAFSAGTGYRLSDSDKTASFDLKHNESVTLRVQADATLTIAETNAQDYTMRLAADKGTITRSSYTVSQNGATITVTNTKDTEVDTGITLDSLPYILLLVLAVLGGIFFLAKHKRRRED